MSQEPYRTGKSYTQIQESFANYFSNCHLWRMPAQALITEHTVPYLWHGKTRFMMVKRVRTGSDRYYIIRNKRGEYTLQFYNMQWNIVSPKPNTFDYALLQVVGNAIHNIGI